MHTKTILISGGLGDFFALDCFVPDKDGITEVWLATRVWREIQTILKALPDWKVRAFHIIDRDWTRGPVYKKQELPEVPADVEDWGVTIKFPQILKGQYRYHQPAYLSTCLSQTHWSRPVVIHGSTTSDVNAQRNLSEREWDGVLGYLDETDQEAVVIGCRGPVPPSPRLTDASGLTGILEAVELVKRASTFIGVDSWPSVVAAKDPAKKLCVKSTNKDMKKWGPIWYAPRAGDFCRPKLPLTLRLF